MFGKKKSWIAGLRRILWKKSGKWMKRLDDVKETEDILTEHEPAPETFSPRD